MQLKSCRLSDFNGMTGSAFLFSLGTDWPLLIDSTWTHFNTFNSLVHSNVLLLPLLSVFSHLVDFLLLVQKRLVQKS